MHPLKPPFKGGFAGDTAKRQQHSGLRVGLKMVETQGRCLLKQNNLRRILAF